MLDTSAKSDIVHEMTHTSEGGIFFGIRLLKILLEIVTKV